MVGGVRFDSYLVGNDGEPLLLEPPEPYVIGRDEDVDLVIGNTVASRRHCELRWDDSAAWVVHDLGSLNGTALNGTRLTEPQALRDRDRLQIAGQEFVYYLAPVGSDPTALIARHRQMLKLADTAHLELPFGETVRDERDLQRAKRLQQHLLARLPAVVGYDFAVYYEGVSGVSGDFYDVGTMADGSTLIVIGDVSGHGVQAAMVVTGLIKSLRALRRTHADPIELLVRLNEDVREDLPAGQFATMVAAKLKPVTGEVDVVLAGHHPGYVFSRTGARPPTRFGEPGMALGLAPAEEFRALLRPQTLRLEKGDALVQFTDGVLESERAPGEIYGMERLGESVSKHAASTRLQAFVDGLAADVRAFATKLEDDLTVFVIARVDDAAPPEPAAGKGRRRKKRISFPSSAAPTEALEGMAEAAVEQARPSGQETQLYRKPAPKRPARRFRSRAMRTAGIPVAIVFVLAVVAVIAYAMHR